MHYCSLRFVTGQVIRMSRNDRKVIDLYTGIELEQSRMLKLLFERSGLKRNEWHTKAQVLVGRSLGSPTKLSDIFGGTRSMPMRDIVPYIQALEMNKEETDYYIGEFFKAYCEESFHQYIRTRSKPKELMLMEQRLSVKDFELKMLKKKLHKLQHVDVPLAIYEEQLKSELKISEMDEFVSSRKNEDLQFKSDSPSSDLKDKSNQKLTQLEHQLEQAAMDCEDDIPEFTTDLEGFISDRPDEYHEKEHDLWYEETFVSETDLWVKWFVVLHLLKYRSSDTSMIEQIALYLPERFAETILCSKFDSVNSEPPQFRTDLEVTAELFSQFKRLSPEQFEKEHQARKTLRNKRTDLGIETDDGKICSKTLVRLCAETFYFRNFILDKYLTDIINLPTHASFLLFEPGIWFNEICHQLFLQQEMLESKGVLNRTSLGELFKLQNPFAEASKLNNVQQLTDLIELTQQKIAIISDKYGHQNPLSIYLNDPDYPNIFNKDYKKPRKAGSRFFSSF